jgi:hypothetical protein
VAGAAVVAVAVAIGLYFADDTFEGPLPSPTEPATSAPSPGGPTTTPDGTGGNGDGDGGTNGGGEAQPCEPYRAAVIRQIRQARVYQEQVILFARQSSDPGEAQSSAAVIGDNLARVEAALTAIQNLGPVPAELQTDVEAVLDPMGRFVELAGDLVDALRSNEAPPDDVPDRLEDLLAGQPPPNEFAGCG